MKPTYWIIAGLAIVIVLMIIFDKDPLQTDTAPYQEAIHRANERIQELGLQKQTLLNDLRSDSIKARVKSDSLKTLVLQKSAEVEKLKRNPIVIRVREEVPEVDTLLTYYEEKNLIQEERILHLEQSGDALKVNMQAIVDNCEERVKAEQEKYLAQNQLTEAAMKENKKLRRNVKLTKIVAVGGLVLGFFLGSQ